MYGRTITPKVKPIENIQQFNQQKMVANNIHKISFPNEPSQGIQNGNGAHNGNGAQNGNSENIFMSRGQRRRREEITPPSPSINGGFSYKEINAKRERIIQEQMAKMQKESQMMMERYMDDAKRRDDLLQNEINMRNQEEITKQQLLQARMDEAEALAKARKDELKRQESLLRHDHLNAEIDAQKRREEATKLQHQQQNMLKGKESQEQKEKEKLKLQAQIRERELQRSEERKMEEMLRQRELTRIQNEIQKEQMQIQYNNSRKNSVDLNGGHHSQRTEGDIQGFGSAKTGIVSRRKLALLTRSNSVGPSDSPDNVPNTGNQEKQEYTRYRSSRSIQGSPMVAKRTFTMPVSMPSNPATNGLFNDNVGRIEDMEDPVKKSYQNMVNEYDAHCEVTTKTNPQWAMLAQQTAAIANTDFANQTKALSSGLTRSQK